MKFFQSVATIRKRHNTIRKINDAQRNWFDDQLGIAQVITRKFDGRFKSDPTCNPSHAIPFSTDISDTDNDFLTKEVRDQEILDAVKHISPLKALGPNGMLAVCYQKNWDIVEKSICRMLRSFFHSVICLRK